MGKLRANDELGTIGQKGGEGGGDFITQKKKKHLKIYIFP
jgi:hypothetical protein